MAVRFLSTAAGMLALVAFAIAPTARAGNVLYNFNSGSGGWTVTSEALTPPEKPWTWIQGPSVNFGGWQAWRGADAFQSASYLVSPLLTVDSVDGHYVRMDIRHRFDFGGTGTTPLLALGQVQYQINSGGWLGIRSLDFGTTSNKIAPAYPNPPYPFIDQTLAPPTGTYAVTAWSGTTEDFATGFHIDSQFELNHQPGGPYTFGPGDTIQFRFLVGTQTPLSGTGAPVIDWEINRIQIDGVDPAVIPEPTALALAGIGGLGCLLVIRGRRRSRAVRAVTGSTAAAVVAGVVVVSLLFAVPARAAPDEVPVADWDFSTGTSGLGWTSQVLGGSGTNTFPLSPSYAGQWSTPSALAPYWNVIPTRGASWPSSWIVQSLTSPVITVPAAVDALDFIIRHRFNFEFGTGSSAGKPLVVGEVAWRFYDPANLNAPFQPFAPSVFATGAVPPPYDALSPYPNWVTNNYVTGTFGVPPLVAAGGAWIGSSPGWAQDDFVLSKVFLDGGLTPGEQVQFRFINAVVGIDCIGSEWDVSRVTVIGLLPEPDGIALAAMGAGSAGISLIVRGRRRFTSGPRDRA